jgi:type VI secretion system protein ImpK
MVPSLADPLSRTTYAAAQPTGALALALQEAFIVAIRLRSQRQVAADPASFRQHVKQLVSVADHEARQLGYDPAYISRAVYAYLAFLDESVLGSRQASFTEWQPLQADVFRDHNAGETFFQYLDELLGHQDSAPLADLLEVYQLCMLLGFRGRFGAAGQSGLQEKTITTAEKIRRIRGSEKELSPSWALPEGEVVEAPRDRWLPLLAALAAGALALCVVVFLVSWLSLRSRTAEVTEVLSQLLR